MHLESVLIVEHGYVDDSERTIFPYSANFLNPGNLRGLQSAPQTQLGGRTYPVQVATVVGGGSVVNGMAFDRGSAADYDAWELLGNPGWDWNSMLKYFKKSTTFTPPARPHADEFNITWDSEYYGTNGPIQVSYPTFEYQDIKTVWKSWYAEKLTFPREHASGDAVGAYWIPNNIDPKEVRRSHARLAYYDPVASRPNLHLVTGQNVNKIIIEKDKKGSLTATGIQYIDRKTGAVSQAKASREVILSAGGVFSPWLLQLSGIGPKAVLEAAGIPVKKDAPAVGANLQDHPTVSLTYNVSNLAFPNPRTIHTNATFNETARAEYLVNKTGPYGYAQRNTLAFLSLPQITDKFTKMVAGLVTQNNKQYLPAIYQSNNKLLAGYIAQVSILASHFTGNKAAIGEMPLAYVGTALSALQKPVSRGTVTLDPKNPEGPPVIQFNALNNPFDKQVLLEMVRWQRRHWLRPELASYNPVELTPGPSATEDDAIFQKILEANGFAPSFAHPSCSCAMMPEALGGVVGTDLRVYGVKGLRVADASIMPLIPATHLQSTVYALAEKAADVIRGR